MLNINIKNLNIEMHYQPGWYLDRDIFINLLNISELDIQDVLIIARLHIKYQPMSDKYELHKCFEYLIHKTNCSTIYDLYAITRKTYIK